MLMPSSAPPSAPVAHDVKPFVPARDFDVSLQFYQDLGWAMNWREGGLAELHLGDARMLLQDFYVPEWAENFMLYVPVDDAEAWHRHASDVIAILPDSGARVALPKRESYGAVVTYVWDPSGVLIHFAEPDASGDAEAAEEA